MIEKSSKEHSKVKMSKSKKEKSNKLFDDKMNSHNEKGDDYIEQEEDHFEKKDSVNENVSENMEKKKKKSNYKMRGMGALLSMYGGAGEEIESNYNEKREKFLEAKEAYALETDKNKREELRQIMVKSKESMELAKEKMKMLLRGVSEASAKAASQLS